MKIFTGVGSRDVPGPRGRLLSFIACHMVRLGWGFRSGGAPGSDSEFERGAVRATGDSQSEQIEIYLPWPGFNGRIDVPENRILGKKSNQEVARQIAKKIHPAGGNLKESHLNLHGRNGYQVLGENLDLPSDFIVYYAEPDGKGSVKGGTRTAVELARCLGIPELNLWYDHVARLLFNLIKANHPDPLWECYKQLKLGEFREWLHG